jgi:hypothetical protein
VASALSLLSKGDRPLKHALLCQQLPRRSEPVDVSCMRLPRMRSRDPFCYFLHEYSASIEQFFTQPRLTFTTPAVHGTSMD